MRDLARRLLVEGVGLWASRRAVSAQNRQRILLIRPDHLGDLLLTSPAIAELRRALPDAHLTLLVGPWSYEVARRGAPVDEIRTLSFPGFSRRRKLHALEPYLLLLSEARQLRDRFDCALILRPDHWWGALLAVLAGAPRRIGWATPLCAPLLTEALPPVDGVHSVELNLRLARQAAGLPWKGVERAPAVRFRLEASERAWAGEWVDSQRPNVLLHPGSGATLKGWSVQRWATVADCLAGQGCRIILSGGPDDLATPRAVSAAMCTKPLLLAGETSIGQLAALAERCAVAIGTDNGPLHIAAAMGTPTVRLYGPTDQRVYGPWPADGAHVTLSHSLPCRPCGHLNDPPCGAHADPPCLLGVDAQRVTAAVFELLDAHRNRR